MSVAAGDRLGPYEIVSRIGAGGMGEVWRARDTRLDRSVAVKVLPAEFAQDVQLQLRFQREARTISQLNHPHICSLFDVGENYLVMELLEGESLETRIDDRGALPLPDVLRYGAQIAEALDRAHGVGIVHRDLKPGNVMITKSGAKLLDFGLAKTAHLDVHGDATQQKRLTESGTIVGTFQYMSPEQLEGREADARSDIFALGALLYEMATGKPAFAGNSRMALIAAIMNEQPAPVAHPALEHIIARCLRKDPDERWQSARDVAAELRWIGESGSRAGVAAIAPKRAARERWLWIALLLAAAGAAAWLATRPVVRAELISASIVADGNSGPMLPWGPPMLSPDGKWLVYAAVSDKGGRMLWLRSMERGVTQPIAGTNEALVPFWSHDGQFIAFTLPNGDLKKIPLAGGEAELITRQTNGGCSWNRDGVILLVGRGLTNSIFQVPAAGGTPAEVVRAASIGAGLVGWPVFLPDGNHFMFNALGGEIDRQGKAGLWIATLDGKTKPRFVLRVRSRAVYVEPGYLLFALDGVLRAQRFDLDDLRPIGDSMAIAPVQSLVWPAWWGALFDASPTGTLVFLPPASPLRTELLLENRKGELLQKIGETGFYVSPRVSPDGRRVAVDKSDANANGDIWIYGLDDRSASRFSFEPHNESAPQWSKRDDELVYLDNVSAMPGALIARKRMGERPQHLVSGHLMPTDWSADGRYVAAHRFDKEYIADVVVWSLDERKWMEVSTLPGNQQFAVFSPDGKWIAYQSEESGPYEIYVQPFPPTGAKYQVSKAGGVMPRWRHAGELVYADLTDRLHAVKVVTQPSFQSGPPEPLFTIGRADGLLPDYDITPEGHVLINAPVYDRTPMKLLVNWQQRLGK